MIKGVIFDLDGVLVSTDQLHFKAWKRLAEEIGIPGYTIEDNVRQRGVSRMDSLEILLEKSERIYTPEKKESLADRKNQYYQELLSESGENILLPGAIKILDLLKQRKVKVAVGSSSRNAPQIIEQTSIGMYIDGLVCGLDITYSKPDPEVFLKAGEKIGVEGLQCLVVEDSAAGIEAAQRAGMRTLAVGYDYAKLDADYRAADLNSVDNWELIFGA